MECEAIPDTHLHLCQIDAGEKLGKEFGGEVKDGLVQVVCGAPNVRAGMWAVWIAPGSVVPATFGGENFRLDVRKLRGYKSNGILAAMDELDLGADHEGILEINPRMKIGSDIITAGASLAEAFSLDDTILEIENKSLTHRPDTFGLIGFAREVAGIMGVKFTEPSWLTEDLFTRWGGDEAKIDVEIEDGELCPRYTCAVMDLSEAAQERSPYLTQEAVFLAKAGMRSISPIVDLTNILMLETGQPLHAFDYDKFMAVGSDKSGARIGVRSARDGEKLELLDGKTIECDENDILITSNDTPVALAGAMGGKNTEIDAETKRIILEVATFSLYHLRKTQMKHGIFSEAVTRFTKGQPAGMDELVLGRAIAMLDEGLGDEKKSSIALTDGGAGNGKKGDDVRMLGWADSYPGKTEPSVVKITTSEINGLLGTDYTEDLIVKTLENVGFEVKTAGLGKKSAENGNAELVVTAPFWRTDIHIPEDIIEEVGRLNGFDNIPQTLPTRPFMVVEPESLLRLKSRVRQIMSDILAGHEVLTYSFVSGKLLKMVGEDTANSYKIVNSISPELQYFRQSLTPSLLAKLPQNLKAGYDNFVLYEMNQISEVKDGRNEEDVPVMRQRLAVVAMRDYYAVKQLLMELARRLGAKVELKEFASGLPCFEPNRSAEIWLDGNKIGGIGEIRTNVLKQFKIKQTVAGFELDLEALDKVKRMKVSFSLSRFPSVTRDVTLKVDSTSYQEVTNCVEEVLRRSGLDCKLTPVSIYQPEGAEYINYSYRIVLTSFEKTLETQEISAIMEKVTNAARKQLGAEVV